MIEDPVDFCYQLGSGIHALSRQGVQITSDQQTFWNLEWMPTRLASGGWFDLFHQIYSFDAWNDMIALLRDAGMNSTADLIEEAVSLFYAAHPGYDYNLPNYGCATDPFSWEGRDADRFRAIGQSIEDAGGGIDASRLREFVLGHPERFLKP